MKVTVKTLRNKTHDLEVGEGETVGDLKKKIETMKLADADTQKLLHKGKILRDSQVATETFAEGDTIILMKTRKKKKKTTVATPEVADENSPRSANGPTRMYQPSAQQLDAAGVYKQIQEMQIRQALEAKIKDLVQRGADPHSAAQALHLAKGDVDLAHSYLTDGIPPELAENFILTDEQKEHVKRSMEAKKAHQERMASDPSKLSPEQQIQMLQKIQDDALATQVQAEAEMAANPNIDLQGMPPRLAMLMSNPQLLQGVLANPMVQAQIQGIMARDMPELFAEFRANPDAVGETERFQKAVFQILGKTMNAPLQPRGRPQVIRLSKEESDGLTVVGEEFAGRFQRQALLQAYMGCGRDLDQLRDFLRQQAAAEDQQSSSEPNPADGETPD